jgi:hypothetical protein
MVSAKNLLNSPGTPSKSVLATPLKILSFNATAKCSPVNTIDLFQKAVLSKEAFEVTGRTGQFQPVIKYANGRVQVLRSAKPNAVELKYKGPKGIQLLVIYSNGNIRMQGTEYNMLLGHLLDLVGTVTDIKFNNTTGVFGTNVRIKDYDKLPGMYFEPEIMPFAYLRVKDPKCTLLFTQSRIVHILGASDIEKAYLYAYNYLKSIPENNLQFYDSVSIPSNQSSPKFNKGKGRKGSTCPKDRRPDPYSFDGKCKCDGDCYVKPNPQGQPCCYQKKRMKPENVRKAYQNSNVNIPNSVRRILGPGSAPKSVSPNRLNTSLDPTGQLKIGTRQCSRYTYQALIEIAQKHRINTTGMKTKDQVCAAILEKYPPKSPKKFNPNFSIGNYNYALVKKDGKRYINRRVRGPKTTKGAAGPRSGLRECMTIQRDELVKYARALGLPTSGTKAELCETLFSAQKPVSAQNNNSAQNNSAQSPNLNNLERNIFGNLGAKVNLMIVQSPGGRIRIDKKLCMSYKKEELVEMARKLGISASGTKEELCKKIYATKR